MAVPQKIFIYPSGWSLKSRLLSSPALLSELWQISSVKSEGQWILQPDFGLEGLCQGVIKDYEFSALIIIIAVLICTFSKGSHGMGSAMRISCAQCCSHCASSSGVCVLPAASPGSSPHPSLGILGLPLGSPLFPWDPHPSHGILALPLISSPFPPGCILQGSAPALSYISPNHPGRICKASQGVFERGIICILASWKIPGPGIPPRILFYEVKYLESTFAINLKERHILY